MKAEKTEYYLPVIPHGRVSKRNKSYEVVADSFTGQVRKRNEDSYVYAWDRGFGHLLTAVADGIGSIVNGDISSNYTLQLLQQAWSRFSFSKPDDEPGEVRDFLLNSVCEINRKLYEVNSITANDYGPDSFGTTISAAVFLKNTMVAVNAGDSPIFRIRAGKIEQLSFDHNLANEMIRMGKVSREESKKLEHGRMLTRFIGPKLDVEPELYVADVIPGDHFLLCSDGLTLHIPPNEICQILSNEKNSLQEAMKILFCTTIQRGAMDNVTLILVKAI